MKINTDVTLRPALTVPLSQKNRKHWFQNAGETFANLLRSLVFAMLLGVAALPLYLFALLLPNDSEDD
ncbi:hypothetical protein [Kamptonema formosum]|uniref:hypothetical protein n=1 Tax=Kamptonema formosum TaxID=331992 RepID=UPI000345DAB7|nr:hypothetical protein [Oscillatoria sp. PCC 10802]